ncbi:hypothetical protein [Streptomyces sp. NPDC088812]
MDLMSTDAVFIQHPTVVTLPIPALAGGYLLARSAPRREGR